MKQPKPKTFSPETCPPLSSGYCDLIDRHDPDPPAVLMTPYEWATLLDVLQLTIEAGLLHEKATIWAQLIQRRLQEAIFPTELAELMRSMNARRARKN